MNVGVGGNVGDVFGGEACGVVVDLPPRATGADWKRGVARNHPLSIL